MVKSNEDRLQEAIEDALDGRAIQLLPDWRHPITPVTALSKLIELKQLSAVRRAGSVAKEQGHDDIAYWLMGYELGLETRLKIEQEKHE